MRGILRVHDFREQEAGEGGRFREQRPRRDGRSENWHVLRTGDGNAAKH